MRLQGKTLQGDPTYAIDIPALCRAVGVKNVYEINAFDLLLLEKTIKEEVARDEVSVIITKLRVYFLIEEKPLYIAHADKCKKCGMCMKPGCPDNDETRTERFILTIQCVQDAVCVKICANLMQSSL